MWLLWFVSHWLIFERYNICLWLSFMGTCGQELCVCVCVCVLWNRGFHHSKTVTDIVRLCPLCYHGQPLPPQAAAFQHTAGWSQIISTVPNDLLFQFNIWSEISRPLFSLTVSSYVKSWLTLDKALTLLINYEAKRRGRTHTALSTPHCPLTSPSSVSPPALTLLVLCSQTLAACFAF